MIEARRRVNLRDDEEGVVTFEAPIEGLGAHHIKTDHPDEALPSGSIDLALLRDLILSLEIAIESSGVKLPPDEKAGIISSAYGDITEHFKVRRERDKAVIFTRSLFLRLLQARNSKS